MVKAVAQDFVVTCKRMSIIVEPAVINAQVVKVVAQDFVGICKRTATIAVVVTTNA
jgi:hypothetical protein